MLLRWIIPAFFAISVAASGAMARPSLSALRTRLDPTALPPVTATCVDGKTGWRKADNSAALQKALSDFPWKKRSYDAPDWNCRLSLEIDCAPNLDGNNKTVDFVARVRWWQRTKTAKGKACASLKDNDPNLVEHEAVLVMNKDGAGAWHAVAIIEYTQDSIDGMAHSRIDYVELPGGKLGFRCKTQTDKGGKGCKVLGYWVGAVVGDSIDRLGEADPEFCKPD